MSMRFATLVSLVFLAGFTTSPAVAASKTIGPGQAYGMGEDIVLSGDDTLLVNGTSDRPARIDANNQQIKTKGDWTGKIVIRHCEFRCLGTAKVPAIDLTALGDGDQI